MQAEIAECFSAVGIADGTSNTMSYAVLVLIIIGLCLLANLIARKVLLKIVSKLIKKNKYSWDDIIYERKVFHRLAHLVNPLIISLFAGSFPVYEHWIRRITSVYMTLVLIMVIDALINAVDDIYRSFEISKTRPIKGILQVIKLIVFIIGAIVAVAALTGQSPFILLGGLGALSAVIILVFQSSILGFVAGIQLTSNDMVRIGDWIQMPKYDADGTVIDLTLTTVKVQNFDKTITTIPAQALVSDSFRNWRGMKAAGARRIKRSISIDISSIRFCSEEMLERFMKIEYLSEYIKNKQKEISQYNKERNIDTSVPVNGRRMTNIGTFRYYVLNYLQNHPGIRSDVTLMVRQLSPASTGLPLEVYGFTSTTDWIEYENIQSDIFDHLMAVLPEFGLRAYQAPTGFDVSSLRDRGAGNVI
jgi:miniconductance mechanosensitive channel